MATVVNDKGEEFDVSDVDAAKMSAADPSLKVKGDIAVRPEEGGSEMAATNGARVLSTEGAIPASASDVGTQDRRNYLRDRTSTLGASLRGGLSGLSGGISDGLFDDDTIEADETHHGTVRGITSVVGAVAPMFLGDEAGITSLFKEPIDAERAAGNLSSKFLLSGEAGGEAGSAGKLIEQGLARTGEHVDGIRAAVHAPEDLSALDAAGLRKVRDAHLDELVAGQSTTKAAAKSAAVDDVVAYTNKLNEANPYLVTGEGSASAPFAKSSRAIRNALDDVQGLRESPGSLLKPLRQQAQALEQTIAEREAIAAKFEATNGKIAKDLALDLQTLPDAATHVELSGKAAKRYGAWADVKVGREATVRVAREDAAGFLQALQGGEVMGDGQKAMDGLQGLLDANKGLQAKLRTAVEPAVARSELTSARLTAIDAARDALATPKTKSLAEQMLGGSIMGHVSHAISGLPIIGPMIGAKVGTLASDIVFGRLGKSVGQAATRTGDAVKAFLGRVAATPSVPVLASRVLARTQYAPTRIDHGSDLASLFRARTDELKTQTAYGPDGKPVMRPDARMAMAAKLDSIRMVDPLAADKLETIGARRVEFLSTKIPRRPDLGGLPNGPDRWQPSDMEMRAFARYCAAVEDPHGVEMRVANGTATPEDAEAYHAVYPERAQQFINDIIAELPNLKKPLPFAKRISLGIFAGIPVDPSMNPNILHVLQDGFAKEAHSEGGTQAPTAQPKFGSVKKSVETPTPAQSRAG